MTDDAARPGAMWSEGGPWGGGAPEGSDDSGGAGPRNPWEQPAGKRAGAKRVGPTALDQLIRTGRSRFGGGGGGTPQFGGKPLWLWGVAALVLLWLIVTCLHTIGPQQRGVVTRLGHYVGTMRPGLGLSLPAPIDIVTRLDVDQINSFDVGDAGTEGEPQDNLVLTGDQNLVDLAYSVRWNIRDPELYLFELAEPETTIREVAESAMREEMARVTLNDAIGPQRSEIALRVAARMQELLDGYRSGVLVQGVAIKQADPPGPVVDAFKAVAASQQQAQSYLNQARAYALQLGSKASGEATAFDRIYAQYKLAPVVTRQRLYYETMEKVLAKTDKTIIEAPGVTPYLPIQPPLRGAGK